MSAETGQALAASAALTEAAQGSCVAVDPNAAIIDRRVVAFRKAALLSAMDAVGHALGVAAGAEVVDVELVPAEQAVVFVFGRGEQATKRRLTGPQLAALLIGYSTGARIPLPSKAVKTVTVLMSGVVLDFVVTFAQAPRVARR